MAPPANRIYDRGNIANCFVGAYERRMRIRWLVHLPRPRGPAISAHIHHVCVESEAGEIGGEGTSRDRQIKGSNAGNASTMQEQDRSTDPAGVAKSNFSNKQPNAWVAIHKEVLALNFDLRGRRRGRA